jgi:hypothetical protein
LVDVGTDFFGALIGFARLKCRVPGGDGGVIDLPSGVVSLESGPPGIIGGALRKLGGPRPLAGGGIGLVARCGVEFRGPSVGVLDPADQAMSRSGGGQALRSGGGLAGGRDLAFGRHLCASGCPPVKRAGRPKSQSNKRNVNHKRQDSTITRIGCSGGAAKLN